MKNNDIALIRLTDGLRITELVQPICLHTDVNDLNTNVNLIVTGWKQTNGNLLLSSRNQNVAPFLYFPFVAVNSMTSELRKVNLKTMPLSECNATLLEFYRKFNLAAFRNGVDESQYCAHDPLGYQDSCQEDSGGPLQTDQGFSGSPKLVGIVSFGTCRRAQASIYTRVAYYIDWIGAHVWPNGQIETLKISE